MIVSEVIHTGPIARWLARRDWAAVTLPGLRGPVIHWWVEYDAVAAEHELIHVDQILIMGRLNYLWTYAREWIHGYRVARSLGDSRRQAASFAYEMHPMESEDWRMRLLVSESERAGLYE